MLAGLLLLLISQQIVQGASHRTSNAVEPSNDLRCFVCESMDREMGDKCVSAPHNYSRQLSRRCRDDARICIVKRFSYTTSTENSTSEPKLWSITRNCTSKCEPGCIIIGERTKLHSCITCCEKHLCNSGTGNAPGCVRAAGSLVALAASGAFILKQYHFMQYLKL